MKPVFIFLIVALLIISACETPVDNAASNETSSSNETPSEPKVEEIKQEVKAEPPAPVPETPPPPKEELQPAPQPAPQPTPQPAPQKPAPQVSAGPASLHEKTFTEPLTEGAKKLLARADEKVKSYDFVYAPPPENIARDKYLIKGIKMKIELYDRGWFNPETHMTAIYMDASTKTAAGFCEDNRLTHCPDPNRMFPLSYDTYALKTPYQWLKEIQYGVLSEGEKINDRMTEKITYIKDGVLYEQWVDTFSGLPQRVKITNSTGELVYDFRHLSINSVTDDIFVHQA